MDGKSRFSSPHRAVASRSGTPRTRLDRRRLIGSGAALGVGMTAFGASLGVPLRNVAAQDSTIKPRAGDEVSFSYLRPTWGPATFTKDGPYQQKLQELGKARIEVQIIPVIDFDTKINTILASGDIPDVVWGGGPMSAVWKEAQDGGAFTPINAYLDQYPALKAAVPDSFWEDLRDDNGDIYFIPQLIYPIVPFSMYYRMDVFEAKGLKEPASLDEFVQTLEALKGDPAISPFTIGYPWHTKDFATVWNFAVNGWQPRADDPNTIEPWFVQQQQIDEYFWFQDMFKRQLLDQNYGINPEPNLSDDRFEGGKSAIAFAHWGAFPKFQTSLAKLDPKAQVGVLPPLSPTAGTRSVFPIDRGFYVAASMGNPDGFFDFLNWTLTDGTTFRRYGMEGKTYTLNGGVPASIPDTGREEAWRGPQIEPLSFIGPLSEKLDWAVIQSDFEGSGIADKFEYVKARFEEYGAHQFFDFRRTTVISPTEGKESTRLYEDILRPVIDSVIINAERTPDDWAAVVQQWREAGGDAIIQEVNELQTDKSQPDYGV